MPTSDDAAKACSGGNQAPSRSATPRTRAPRRRRQHPNQLAINFDAYAARRGRRHDAAKPVQNATAGFAVVLKGPPVELYIPRLYGSAERAQEVLDDLLLPFAPESRWHSLLGVAPYSKDMSEASHA